MGVHFFCPKIVEGGECKNLFLRNNEGINHYLVILGMESRCDLKVLARKLNEKRLGFASEDRLLRYLGVPSGSVSPFNLLNGNGKEVLIVVEEALLSHEKLAFHPYIWSFRGTIASELDAICRMKEEALLGEDYRKIAWHCHRPIEQ